MNRKELNRKSHNTSLRARRTRSKIKGTKTVPRISVFPSLCGFKVQFIDDESGRTILFGSDSDQKGAKTQKARDLGLKMAHKAVEIGIISGVLDKGSKKYHGRIKAFADALREGGMKL